MATFLVFSIFQYISKWYHLQLVPKPYSFPRGSFINDRLPSHRAAHATALQTEWGRNCVLKHETRSFIFFTDLNPTQICREARELQQGASESCGAARSGSSAPRRSSHTRSGRPSKVPACRKAWSLPREFGQSSSFCAKFPLHTHGASHCKAEMLSRQEKMW